MQSWLAAVEFWQTTDGSDDQERITAWYNDYSRSIHVQACGEGAWSFFLTFVCAGKKIVGAVDLKPDLLAEFLLRLVKLIS